MDGFLLYVIMLKVAFYPKTLKHINTFPSEYLVNSISIGWRRDCSTPPSLKFINTFYVAPNKRYH